MKTYRPLPECLTIKDSDINGIGLFAVGDIPKGTNLGISHKEYDCAGEIDRTMLGGAYNSPNKPENANCIKEIIFKNEWTEFHLITIKDILEGEELLVIYTFTCYDGIDFNK